MKSKSRSICLLLFYLVGIFFLLSCAKEGDGKKKTPTVETTPKEEPKEEEAKKEDRFISNNLSLLERSFQSEHFDACRQPAEKIKLANGNIKIAIDGNFDDWQDHQPVIFDPLEPHLNGFDISKVYLLDTENRTFHLAISGEDRSFGNNVFYIEMGGGYTNDKGKFVEKGIHYLRFSEGVLERKVNDNWEPIDDSLIEDIHFSEVGMELEISSFIFGEVIYYPMWWLRVSTANKHDKEDVVVDFTATQYFPNRLATHEQKYIISGCLPDVLRKSPLFFRYIRESYIDESTARKIVGLANAVYYEFGAIIPSNTFPVSSLSFLLSDNDLSEPSNLLATESVLNLPRAIRIDLKTFNNNLIDSVNSNLDTYVHILRRIIEVYLRGVNSVRSEYLATSINTAISSYILRINEGMYSWSLQYRRDMRGLGELLKSEDDLSSENRSELKARAFGYLLESLFDIKTLIDAWISEKGDDDNLFVNKLLSSLSEDDKEGVSGIIDGWLSDKMYDSKFHPSRLIDDDEDGLPNYIEAKMGLNPLSGDSDEDGWSDLGERILGTSPSNGLTNPQALVPDGFFGDWLDLLPRRVIADTGGSAEGCPQSSDITFYSGILTKDQLTVAAKTLEMNLSPDRVKWEVHIDLPKLQKSYLIKAEFGENRYEVYNKNHVLLKSYILPYAFNADATEFTIHFDHFSIKTNLDEPESVKVRLATSTTIDGKDHFCDDTPWFDVLTQRI